MDKKKSEKGTESVAKRGRTLQKMGRFSKDQHSRKEGGGWGNSTTGTARGGSAREGVKRRAPSRFLEHKTP